MSVVTEHNVVVGMKVKRGPDWCYSNQDLDSDGNPVLGKITGEKYYRPSDLDCWVDVMWENGHNNNYRIGPLNFDLVEAVDEILSLLEDLDQRIDQMEERVGNGM